MILDLDQDHKPNTRIKLTAKLKSLKAFSLLAAYPPPVRWTRATARAEFFRYKSRFNIKKRYNKSMKPKEKKEIFNFLEYNKNILQSYGVKKIGLFGSYVHNQQNKNSDIDILVEFHADKKNYNNFINLVYYLEDNLNTKIDLLTIESLSPYIGQRILNEVEYVSIK